MSLIIIKLGGSVITYKDSHVPKPRIKIIERLAKEILSLHKKGYKIILVHGGGSFGHNLAKKYNLNKGLKSTKSLIGLTETVQSMSKLNSIVMNLLIRAGLPAVSLTPHSFITQTGGKFEDFDTKTLENILDHGFIPVLYGDGVIDKKLGCSIISGDTITTYLGKKLNAKKVIFLSEVDGILNDTKIIPEVNNTNLKEVLKAIKRKNHEDVTGEMRGKLLSIKENLAGKDVSIINGLIDGNLTRELLVKCVGTSLFF